MRTRYPATPSEKFVRRRRAPERTANHPVVQVGQPVVRLNRAGATGLLNGIRVAGSRHGFVDKQHKEF